MKAFKKSAATEVSGEEDFDEEDDDLITIKGAGGC